MDATPLHSQAPIAPSLTYFPAGTPVFRCLACNTVLSLPDQLVSKSFTAPSGPAFLVRTTLNTTTAAPVSKLLLTGKHIIGALQCAQCNAGVGWRYFAVSEGLAGRAAGEQGYKKDKAVLEREAIYKVHRRVHSNRMIPCMADFCELTRT